MVEPLGHEETSHIKEYWQQFESTLPSDERPFEPKVEAAFAGNESTTDELIALFLSGKKTAGSSLVRDFEFSGDVLPKIGNYWIALDSHKIPRCILKTVRIAVHKFRDIPSEIARAEGEGDLSVEYWKRIRRDLYSPYLSKWGIADLNDADVITEFFEIVYP